MNTTSRTIKGLGEVSLHVKDLKAMQRFYEGVLGLEVLGRDNGYVFFKIADGYGGHTQNLALFDADNRLFLENKSAELNPDRSTLHHVALNIALEDYNSERRHWRPWG